MAHKRILSLALTFVASFFARISGLATQVVTAWYLTEDQFGLYAIALGITTFTQIMRGGGTGIVYQTMTPSEYSAVGGGLLRAALTFAILGALLTAGAALPARAYYDQSSLGWLLLSMAALFIMNHAAVYPRARMASALKFKQLAGIEVACSLIKLLVAWWCASHGWGAMTFVIAQVAAMATQFCLASIWADYRRSDFALEKNWIANTAAILKYPLIISMVISMSLQIDWFVASLFIPVGALGVYYFATQLAGQPIQVISGGLQLVLAPYAAHGRGNANAEHENIVAAFTSGAIFVPLFTLSLAAVYPSLEFLLWGGRWANSHWPVMICSILLVYPTMQSMLEGPILGLRRWHDSLALLSWRTGSKAAGALLAALVAKYWELPETSIAMAMVVGVGAASTITAYLQIRKFLIRFGVDQGMVDYELYSTPLYALLAVIATHGVVSSIVGSWLGTVGHSRLDAAIECIIGGVTYIVIAAVLLRFAYYGKLKVLVSLLPRRPRLLACRLLVVDPAEIPLLQVAGEKNQPEHS